MDYQGIYKKTEHFVSALFGELQQSHLVFHNLQHTRKVVERVKEICGHYKVSERDMLIVFTAAWFHDSGFLYVQQSFHEEKSVEVMRDFMSQFSLAPELIEEIAGCIIATRQPRNPAGLLQEIICDADTYHFGTKEFWKTNKLISDEYVHYNKGDFSKVKFDEETLAMLEKHRFYTIYCRDLLDRYKKKNMKKLKNQIEEAADDAELQSTITEKLGTTKGMQTMLRLTSSNHIQLSEMADSKANILISVNAIIISVILSVLLRKLQTDPYLTIPTLIFLVSSVVTIVIAILATRPKLNTGTFNAEDIVNKRTNLLFFGNFHRMTWDRYESAMRTMMRDSDYLYTSIIQDIYHLGVVLGKKYKLIRLAYNVFMFGIVISVVAFALAAFLQEDPSPVAVNPNSSGSPF